MLKTSAWEFPLGQLVGVPPANIRRVWDDIPGSEGSHDYRYSALLDLLVEREQGWPEKSLSPIERLGLGIYSPIQVMMMRCIEAAPEAAVSQYPFLFDLCATFCDSVLKGLSRSDEPAGPAPDSLLVAQYRQLFQSLFALREMREEGENLTIEVHLPLKDEETAPRQLEMKRFAQVFGRGITTTRQTKMAVLEEPVAEPTTFFPTHQGAPLSALYHLESPFPHVVEDSIAIVLDRRGRLAVARRANPFIEFYDGGWHCVDLQAGRAAFSDLVLAYFDSKASARAAQKLSILAYHMATHGHGGILAMIDTEQAGDILKNQSSASEIISDNIKSAAPGGGSSATVTELAKEGLGRLLLSAAIQDGAMVFGPEGEFHSAGQLVSRTDQESSQGGARRSAAKALSAFGAVLAISQDGAIRVFGDRIPEGDAKDRGVRIH